MKEATEQFQLDKAVSDIVGFEEQLKRHADMAVKLKATLTKLRASVATGKNLDAALGQTVGFFRDFPSIPELPDPTPLRQSLSDQLALYLSSRQDLFMKELQRECKNHGIELLQLTECLAVGPFAVYVDWRKEKARFEYAKVSVKDGVTLHALTIVEAVLASKTDLIDAVPDVETLELQLDEALRVAVTRMKKKPSDEMRVELPALYREMEFIHSLSGAPKAGTYSRARFVIELKHILQSERNRQSKRRYVPEPATIENTKQPKKSIFVPTDINRGFGEGQYFQALKVVANQ